MRSIVAALLVAIVAACGTIPTDALNAYVGAFNAAREASDDFFIQFGQTQAAAKAFIARHNPTPAAPFSPYPTSLTSSAAQGVDRDVEAMRLSFEVVAQYNNALVALADGKSVETVGAATEGLLTAVGNFIPVAGPVVGAASTLARELEKARLREEFKAALAKGAPLVRQILAIIDENVDTNYANNVLLADNKRTLLVADAIDKVRKLIGLSQLHVAPDDLDAQQAQLDALLQPITQETNAPKAFPLGYDPSMAPYTAATEAQVTALMEAIGRDVAAYETLNARLNGLAKAGREYKQLLQVVQASLSALEAADATPPNLNAQAAEILRLGFLIKTHVEEVRNAGASVN